VRVGAHHASAVSMRRSFARHSGGSRNPTPSLSLFLEVQSFHSPCGRAGHFLCLCKESNQRNTPPVARSPGILPCECASGLRGSLSAHPCARSELARILRATLRAFPPPARRATGGPVWAASCRRSNSNRACLLLLRQFCSAENDRIDAVQGCTDSCTTDRRVRCLAFCLLLGNAKSRSLARRASESSALEFNREERSWITRDSRRVPFGPFAARTFAPASCLRSPAFAGMTSFSTHAYATSVRMEAPK